MASPNIHVVPADDYGWAVEETGGRHRRIYNNPHDAIVEGTARARTAGVALLIHGRDGAIVARNSYGHDPRKTKD